MRRKTGVAFQVVKFPSSSAPRPLMTNPAVESNSLECAKSGAAICKICAVADVAAQQPISKAEITNNFFMISHGLERSGKHRPISKVESGALSDPSFFFSAKKFFRGPALAGANESGSGKYSGSWLAADSTPRQAARFILLPAFTFGLAEDWHLGSRIQLQQRNCLRISRSSFHRIAITKLAKNCGEFMSVVWRGKFFSREGRRMKVSRTE